jgi:hypothetical protein
VAPERDHSGGDADLDAAFAEIISGWDDETTDPVPRWPASEDADEAPPPASSMEQIRYARDHGLPTPDHDPDSPAPVDDDASAQVRPVEPAPAGPRDWELADTEEHFEPPEPPPLPHGDLTSRLAWAAVIAGPAFLLYAGLFWREVSRLWLVLAALGFVAGFVVLVMRLPQSRDDDDDGAVV